MPETVSRRSESALMRWLRYALLDRFRLFRGSKNYWERRYIRGGSSGAGSYDDAARFKADVLNRFVRQQNVVSVIEFGCGDGNQLTLAEYPKYIGVDVSQAAVAICKEKFATDPSKTFFLLEKYQGEQAELVLSLDVIYHLVEHEVFASHMDAVFRASSEWVIIYSSNTEHQRSLQASHVRHRRFTDWIERNVDGWKLFEYLPSQQAGADREFIADFFIYKRSLD